jgi:diacylglycerol kinase (ATP)
VGAVTGRPHARRHLVIWNPAAGSKAGLPTNTTTEDELRRTMHRAGLGDDLFGGASEDAARQRVREAVEAGVDVVVAAGGDGTAGMVAEEIIGTPTALGFLPLGSAMNIGRSLGIPRELGAAAEILATGDIVTVDVGRASDGLFFEMASVGINAAVLAEAHRLAEGDYESIVGMIRAILTYRPATMTLEMDDETVETGALMVVVANTPFTGAGLTLAPEARMDDGRFDIAVYRHFSRWELARHMVSIVAGRRRYSPKVRTFRSKGVRITAHRPLPARADARDLGTTPIELEVVPHALKVVVAAHESRPPAALGGPALSA